MCNRVSNWPSTCIAFNCTWDRKTIAKTARQQDQRKDKLHRAFHAHVCNNSVNCAKSDKIRIRRTATYWPAACDIQLYSKQIATVQMNVLPRSQSNLLYCVHVNLQATFPLSCCVPLHQTNIVYIQVSYPLSAPIVSINRLLFSALSGVSLWY